MATQTPDNYAELVDVILQKLLPWRKFTIAVDGVDNSGKSSLARFMSWQLKMPTIETDLLMTPTDGCPTHDMAMIGRLVSARHNLNRPVIVEGVFVLETLSAIGVIPDVLIRVEAVGRSGSFNWHKCFAAYLESNPRAKVPDHRICWHPENAAD